MNKNNGCLGIIIGLFILALVIQILKLVFLNILGILGIVVAVIGICFAVTKNDSKFGLYWPIASIVSGLFLTFSWFIFREYLITLAFLSVFLFLYFLITTLTLAIRKSANWKKFSLLSTSLLVLMIIFISIAPDIDSNKSEVASSENNSNLSSTDKNTTTEKKTIETSNDKKDKVKQNDNKVETKKSESKNVAAVTTTPKKVQKKKSTKSSNRVPVTLTKTVDGDTIKVMYKGKEESVRYLLIDTPESKKPGSCVQPYAESAYNRNKQLVNSGKLTLEFEKSERDKYGRLLAYVFVDGKSVQETLLKEGYARVAYIYEPPYKYLSKYQKAEDIAKNKHSNIWSKSGLVTDKGFNGCATKATVAKKSNTTRKSIGNSSPKTNTTPPPTSGGTEFFANCTELRKKYPNGVPSTHPAYQPKMDRDKDGYACER
ncbi:thermonuclease family protein [Heyndrickxia sporothermodurans]|uniref:thermonuclease family protein n=1 Tax=Heyndrickxia sporothermodurans TaxID=46224 RepID=UPI0036D39291